MPGVQFLLSLTVLPLPGGTSCMLKARREKISFNGGSKDFQDINWAFKRQPHKMVRHSVFGHFMGLALKALRPSDWTSVARNLCRCLKQLIRKPQVGGCGMMFLLVTKMSFFIVAWELENLHIAVKAGRICFSLHPMITEHFANGKHQPRSCLE